MNWYIDEVKAALKRTGPVEIPVTYVGKGTGSATLFFNQGYWWKFITKPDDYSFVIFDETARLHITEHLRLWCEERGIIVDCIFEQDKIEYRVCSRTRGSLRKDGVFREDGGGFPMQFKTLLAAYAAAVNFEAYKTIAITGDNYGRTK